MLRSGDRVKVVGNSCEHGFEIGEKVYSIGVIVDEEIVFVFTNGKIEQGLYVEDFELFDV